MITYTVQLGSFVGAVLMDDLSVDQYDQAVVGIELLKGIKVLGMEWGAETLG